MRRLALLILTPVVFALGCGDREPTTAPNSRPGGPRLDISDGAHDAGNDGFFFLPPMVKEPVGNPKYKDELFHGGMRPHVDICQLDDAGLQCVGGDPFKRFAPEQISVSNETYQVNWDTKERPLLDGKVYRVRVLVGDVQLGYADVKHADNRSELKNVDTDEFVPLVDGRTLPIKFRIEQGALCDFDAECTSTFVDKDEGGTFYAADEGAAIDFSPGVLPVDVVLTIERIPVLPGAPCVGDAAVGNVVFQQWEGCYRITTAPDIAPFGGFQGPTEGKPARAIVAVCIEPGVPAQLRENLVLHKFDEGEDLETPTPVTPPFPFSCEGFQGTPSPGPISFAREGIRMFAAGLGRLLGPRPAYAVDGGLGCILSFGGSLSTFFWGMPVTGAVFTGDGQEVEIGTAVPIAPAVVVTAFHADAHEEGDEPVSDVPVTFQVFGTNGKLVSPTGATVPSIEVLTNADGVAALPAGAWVVGGLVGANILKAFGPFENGPVTFTVTGTEGGSIAGTVRNAAGAPIDGALVRLVSTSDETFEPQSTTTDDGEYSFTDLPAGSYFVSAAAIGFEITREFVPLDEAQDDITDLVLWPLGSVSLSYSDPTLPEDDDVSTAGDVTSVQLVFNLVDGTYQATWNADPARPFNGNLRLNLNLGNTRLGGDLLPLVGIFSNVNSQTQLSYRGTAAALTTWLVGDIIASAGTSPQFATDFNSGLVDLDDIALSNRDLLQQTLAEIIPKQQ